MKVGIIGAGAIGGWVAAKLARAGHHVSALARGATRDALANGLELVEGGETATVQLQVSDRASELGPQDFLVIAVKAPSLAEAAETAAQMIGPETIILPMLNGLPWWFAGGEPLRSIDPGGRI